MRIGNWIATTAILAVIGGTMVSLAADKPDGKKKLLMFSPSFGFRHSCVTRPLTGELSHAEKVLKDVAGKAGYDVYFSQDFNDLKGDGQFKQFDAILLYTTQSPSINRDAMTKWLQAGGALIGVHCATDSFYDWEDYSKFMGGQFKTHGPANKDVVLKVEEQNHPATRHLGEEWTIADEIYHFRDGSFSRDNVDDVLLSVDTEKTDLEPQKMSPDKDYPVSWINTFGDGRILYTSLGHREEVWSDPVYQKHLLGGIAWTLHQDKSE